MATAPASSSRSPTTSTPTWSDFDLPARGHYATGIAFLSRDPDEAADARRPIGKLAGEEGLEVLGWRPVPVARRDSLGSIAEAAMPSMHQLFVAPAPGTSLAGADPALAIDRLAFVLRKRAEHEIDDCYFASLSARTITYKGMLTSHQLAEFFPDLSDERVTSGLALVHSRFSTNTFPSWPLAHPYRYLAHNGEINTLAGNRNWMRAREALCAFRPDPRARAGLPHRDPGGQRLGLLRRGARAAPPGRPPPPPRRADDDPRGVGEPPDHGPGPPGLLPLPRRR